MNEAFMLLRRRRGILEVLPDNSDDNVESVLEAFADKSPSPERVLLATREGGIPDSKPSWPGPKNANHDLVTRH